MLFVIVFSCQRQPSYVIPPWRPYDESKELAENANHPSKKMQYKLIQSKLLDKNKIWKIVSDQLCDFTEEKYEALKPFILEQDIPTLQSNSFDCVTMWHVLEHFHDPQKYIKDILTLLKPGGICTVALPNSSSFDALHYGKFWAAFDIPRHLWHFDPETFSHFAGKNGLIIECYFMLPFDVFYISALSEKYRGSPLPFLKGIAWGCWFAFLTIFNRKRSSSVIYILRKPTDQ